MKKLLLFALIFLLVGSVSAFEFDNVKSYDEKTRTITIKNSFLGLPLDKVAEIKLNTPSNYNVPRGYQKVAEFELILFDDYTNTFKELEFYDINKNNEKFTRGFDYKVLSYEKTLVDDYGLVSVGFYGNGTEIYESQIIGTHQESREKWTKLTSLEFNKNTNFTIGIFTNVQKGDRVEWIPNYFGVRIDEWAAWSESLNVDLVAYYKFDEQDTSGTGSINDSLGTHNGTNDGADNITGKINTAYDFVTANTDLITIPDHAAWDTDYLTVSYWMNLDVLDKRQMGRWTTDLSWLAVVDVGSEYYFEIRTSAGAYNVQNANGWETGVWHLHTITYNGTALIYYIDGGNESTTATGVGTLDTGGSIITFGDQTTGGANAIDGKLDEIGIWNRSLSASEVSDLWNGGDGISHSPGPFGAEPVTVTLNSPENDTSTNEEPITFNATITPDVFNLTNATLILWYENGTTFTTQTNTSISLAEAEDVIFNVTDLGIGSYVWNVLGIQGNANDTNSSFADENFTFEWIPFEIVGEDQNNFTFETINETFNINITTDPEVTNIGAFLSYNGTSYAATHTCSSGLCQIEREIDIPLLLNQTLNSENKSFFWTITLFGSFGTFTTNTATNQQNVSNVDYTNLTSGNSLATTFETYNESDLNLIITDFDVTFNFYLGKGSVHDDNNYSLSGASSYNFYINHNETFFVNSTIRIMNDTNERNYFFVKESYTNTTTIHELFVPYTDISNIIVEVKDQGLIPLEGYLVKIFRFYPSLNQYKLVESQLTDEFGQFVAKLVQNDVKYKFEFFDGNKVLQKTSKDITVACRSSFCVLPFVIETVDSDFERFENLTLFSFDFEFNNNTNTFILSWDDQRQESSTIQLEVIRFQFNQTTTVCDSTSTSKVSSLTCAVGSEKATYKGTVSRTLNGVTRRIALLNISIGSPFSTFGVEGLLWVFILLFTGLAIGAFNPSVGASIYGAGFIIFGVIGIISMPLPVFFANTLLVILFIWAVKT